MVRGLPDYARGGLSYAEWLGVIGEPIDRAYIYTAVAAGADVEQLCKNNSGKRWWVYYAYVCSPVDTDYTAAQRGTFYIKKVTPPIRYVHTSFNPYEGRFFTFPRAMPVEDGETLLLYLANLGTAAGDFVFGWSGVQEI